MSIDAEQGRRQDASSSVVRHVYDISVKIDRAGNERREKWGNLLQVVVKICSKRGVQISPHCERNGNLDDFASCTKAVVSVGINNPINPILSF